MPPTPPTVHPRSLYFILFRTLLNQTTRSVPKEKNQLGKNRCSSDPLEDFSSAIERYVILHDIGSILASSPPLVSDPVHDMNFKSFFSLTNFFFPPQNTARSHPSLPIQRKAPHLRHSSKEAIYQMTLSFSSSDARPTDVSFCPATQKLSIQKDAHRSFTLLHEFPFTSHCFVTLSMKN